VTFHWSFVSDFIEIGLSYTVPNEIGLQQRDALSPLLVNSTLEYIKRAVKVKQEVLNLNREHIMFKSRLMFFLILRPKYKITVNKNTQYCGSINSREVWNRQTSALPLLFHPSIS